MIALCVDDEVLLLDALRKAVEQSPDITQVVCFSSARKALEWAEENWCDIAFLDIQLRGTSGLALAEKLLNLHPDLPIIFCTGYDHYALEAIQRHLVTGYLTKPIRAEAIQRELDHLKKTADRRKLLTISCFGNFDVWANGSPLDLHRKKTRELLAYLVHAQGSEVTPEEACIVLWNDSINLQRNIPYLRQLLSDLRCALKKAGAEQVLIASPQGYAIDPRLIDCDYYRFLAGDQNALPPIAGDYLSFYSWAAETREQIKNIWGGVERSSRASDNPSTM